MIDISHPNIKLVIFISMIKLKLHILGGVREMVGLVAGPPPDLVFLIRGLWWRPSPECPASQQWRQKYLKQVRSLISTNTNILLLLLSHLQK